VSSQERIFVERMCGEERGKKEESGFQSHFPCGSNKTCMWEGCGKLVEDQEEKGGMGAKINKWLTEAK
jgi:hypothetical protein